MMSDVELCECGQPSTRTLGTTSYCDPCADNILTPFKERHPSTIPTTNGELGTGQQIGALRPDYGPNDADLECDTCMATWVGEIGEPCPYCITTADKERRERKQALALVTNEPAPLEPVKTMRDRLLSVEQLNNMPQLEPIVSQLLDFNTVALIYGRRASAKSFLAVDLTASIASGTRWHGHTVTCAPALYVVAEGAAGLGVRYNAWRQQDSNLNAALASNQLAILPDAVNLLNLGQVAEFAAMAADLGSRLIVLDTLARCMVGGDENSARDTGMAIEQLDHIRRLTQACVIVIHHTGKNPEAGARGSSALEGAADTVLEVGMTDGIVTLTCTKQKNHPEPNSTRLRLKGFGSSAVLTDYYDDGSELSKSCLETLAALSEVAITGGVSSGVWQASSSVAVRSFYRHRQALLTADLVSNVGSTKMPRYQVTPAGTAALSSNCQVPF